MESKTSSHASLITMLLVALLLGFLSHHTIATFDDQKNYYSPDPHASTPPPSSGSNPPSHGSGGGHGSHHGTPSHGGGGGGGNNNNCGTPPPAVHDPPSTPSPTPTTPSNPPSSGGYSGSPPTTPVDPGTPNIPSPPFLPSPFTGTCNYWSTHPGIVWGVLGWWGTLGNAFGVPSSGVPGVSPGLTLPQALSNTRTDGIGALLREGTASYLNSLVNHRFPYTTSQVRDRFVASLNSNKAAQAQAQLFKMANEGKMKP